MGPPYHAYGQATQVHRGKIVSYETRSRLDRKDIRCAHCPRPKGGELGGLWKAAMVAVATGWAPKPGTGGRAPFLKTSAQATHEGEGVRA